MSLLGGLALGWAAVAPAAKPDTVTVLGSALEHSRAEIYSVADELQARRGGSMVGRDELRRRGRSAENRAEALEWALGRLWVEARAVAADSAPAADQPTSGAPWTGGLAGSSEGERAWALGELLRRPRPRRRPRVRATWRNWRVTGDVFAGVRGNGGVRDGVETETSGADVGASLNVHGFVIDPRFVVFDLGADFQDVRNDLNRQETDFSVAGFRLQTRLLPERPWPFTFRLRSSKTDSLTAIEDRRFDFTTDFLDIGASWQLRLPDRPQLTLSYDKASGSSVFSEAGVPSSENSNRTLAGSLTHSWRGWTWTGGYVDTASALDLGPSGRTDRELDRARFSANTRIGEAGRLSFTGFRQNSRDRVTQTGATASEIDLDTRDTFFGWNLDARHTGRLRGTYRLSWSDSEFEQAGVDEGANDFSNRLFGARLSFERTERLTLFWDASVQSFDNGAIASEFPDQLYTLGPGLAYRREVGAVLLEGWYQPVWSFLKTTLDETASFWSHIVRMAVEVGAPEKLKARAEYRYSDVQQITRIGSFDRQRVFRLRLTSARFEPLVLRGHVTLSRIALLNRAGQQDLDDLSWALSADRKILGLVLGHSSATGSGFDFAETADTGREITDPLPTDLLVPSPFLRRESRRSYVRGRFRPLENLQLNVSYQTESSEFAVAPDLDRDWWDVFAEYRLGRFTLTGGYLREDYSVDGQTLDRDRHYVRLARSFAFSPSPRR